MTIKTRDVSDVVVFDIDGEIRRIDTLETEPTLHQLVKTHLDQGRRNILLNLENVEFVDSFGIGEILASFVSIQGLGGKLKLAGISKKLRVVFKITQIDKVLDIRENEHVALESFSHQ